MIEFKNVYIKYVKEFFSLFNFTCNIKTHTLFVGDFYVGTIPILRILSKLDKEYTGEVFINNTNLKNIKDKDLNLAYLPEQTVLFKNKNIFKNLYFPLNLRKINKNSAKSLIFSIFSELKSNNFNFLNHFLLKKNKHKNIKSDDDLINSILKIKINKLNKSEQKILTLIRAVLRKPKYVLLENFFEDLDETHVPLAQFLINKLKLSSTVIACEKYESKLEYFTNFEIIKLNEDK